METIYALSTVFGKSGVAVFRISGEDAIKVLDLFSISVEIKHRYAHFVDLLDGELLVDRVLLLYFRAPHSFTGEDVIEIQCHGSLAVIERISSMLSSVFRLANAGEFTRRAVMNNKMDLTEAEGVIDLINAETEQQLRQAARQISGELSIQYEKIRSSVIKALSYLEAYIDFPDEDIPSDMRDAISTSVMTVKKQLSSYLNDGKRGEKIRHGFLISIIGEPNVGKSSLFNCLAGREMAIVTEIEGTTRDSIEVKLNVDGYPVILVDSAGIRETSDKIEKEGIKRALHIARTSDIVLFLRDVGSAHQSIQLQNFLDELHTNNVVTISVVTKVDTQSCYIEKQSKLDLSYDYVPISVHNGFGIEVLYERIASIISNIAGEAYIITHHRHRNALKEALSHLEKFELDIPIEIAAEELRLAAESIGSVTGKIKLDEVLDEIFSSFCIGK